MESSFQFTNPVLRYLEFGMNNSFDNKQKQQVKLGLNFRINIDRKDESNLAEVELEVRIGEKSGEAPFFVIAKESADFKWEKEYDQEFIDKLLQLNAPALLLSYLRPIIAQVTASSFYNAYNIPFINFTNMKNNE